MIIRVFGKISIVALLAIMTIGCQKEDLGSGDNTSINSWIYNSFAKDYLWRTEMRPRNTNPIDSYPVGYFNEVIRAPKDNYSYCSQPSGVAQTGRTVAQGALTDNDFGFKERFLMSIGSTEIQLCEILYVVAGSPAHKAGLKRGDIIKKINSQTIPMSLALYGNIIGASKVTIEINNDPKEITLTRTPYLNNPVLFDGVSSVDGVKVGYLIYSHFSSGNGVLSDKLNEACGRLKAQGVTDLILDLRYNSGGEIEECRHLASLIVPRTMLFDTFLYQENAHNFGNAQNFVRTYFLQPAFVDRYSVGAKRLFILTSGITASASEIIMHALKPFYGDNMKIFGSKSAGKNVGGIRTVSADGRWVMNKITIRIYNKHKVSGYETGIVPDYEVSEGSSLGSFGDVERDNGLRYVHEIIYGKKFGGRAQLRNKMLNNNLTYKYMLNQDGMLLDCLKK